MHMSLEFQKNHGLPFIESVNEVGNLVVIKIFLQAFSLGNLENSTLLDICIVLSTLTFI